MAHAADVLAASIDDLRAFDAAAAADDVTVVVVHRGEPTDVVVTPAESADSPSTAGV